MAVVVSMVVCSACLLRGGRSLVGGMNARCLKRLIPWYQKGDQGYVLHYGRAWMSVAAAQAETVTKMPRSIFQTSENNPSRSWCGFHGNQSSQKTQSGGQSISYRHHRAVQVTKHGDQHEGQHYVLPVQEVKSIFPHGLPFRFQLQTKTFNETCLMVRRPALEVINYLRNTNFSHPAVRYIIYGQKGTGKSLTLCHVIHYCAREDWLLVHIPDAHILVKNCKELLQSSHKKGRYDQPLEASTWLKSFKITNERFLKEIRTQQRYVWSKREVTEEGRPLGEVVDQGINRLKSATDVVGAVLKELKRQCPLGAFRMLVAADGVNSLWGRTTLKKEDKSPIAPEELTLVHNLRKMMLNDWNGGAIVTTVSRTGSLFQPYSAYLPHELLGKEGFDSFDPFVPIQVSNYSEREFESCYQYYLERHWLQHENAHTEEGKKELLFLSNSNPRELERICAFL